MSSEKKITVAFVLPDLTPGGAEMVLIRLANGLQREKFQAVFIAVNDQGSAREFIDTALSFHSLNQKKLITAIPLLYEKIKEIRPDIVITTMAHMNFVVLMLKPFFKGTKFIVRESTVPDCTLEGRGWRVPLIRMLYIFLYPFADKIIAPARIILEKMRSQLRLSMTRMAVLPNPVDTQKIKPALTPSTTGEPIHFITAGRLHYEKGFDRLIKSLKDYRGPEWRLTILGEGPQRDQLEYMIDVLKLSEKISLPGFSKEPWAEFSRADCFLLPSRWEGMPNAALEALACGLPVIAMYEAGGIHEIAANSTEGAITIVRNMPAFLKAMAEIKPAQEKNSMLPDIYKKENVMKEFEKILDDVLI